MFVRWKATRLQPPKNQAAYRRAYREYKRKDDATRLTCQLVEAYREDGRPRQRVVAHLGSLLDEQCRPKDFREQAAVLRFFLKVDKKLESLGITAEDAAEYRLKIGERIRRGTKKTREKMRLECASRMHPDFVQCLASYGMW